MKASELMVGDILWYDPWASFVTVSNIEEPVDEKSEGQTIIRRYDNRTYWERGDELRVLYFDIEDEMDNLHGVKIDNEKFLEKNGDILNELVEKESISLFYAPNSKWKLKVEFRSSKFSGECFIEYVHELQNLLNLMGEEIKFNV